MNLEKLKNKKYSEPQLKQFGFKKEKDCWKYSKDIMQGDFCLYVTILKSGEVKTELIETETKEPYTLHLVEGAEGKFIGKVKHEYESVIDKIIKNCYEMSVFEFKQAIKILEYAKSKYDTPAEYLWEKFPRNAICRRKDNKKWYFAILSVKASRLGFDTDEIIEVLDIRAKKDIIPELLNKENYYPAYHMNKKSWITVVLDGSLNIKEIYRLIDDSYKLALGK